MTLTVTVAHKALLNRFLAELAFVLTPRINSLETAGGRGLAFLVFVLHAQSPAQGSAQSLGQ